MAFDFIASTKHVDRIILPDIAGPNLWDPFWWQDGNWKAKTWQICYCFFCACLLFIPTKTRCLLFILFSNISVVQMSGLSQHFFFENLSREEFSGNLWETQTQISTFCKEIWLSIETKRWFSALAAKCLESPGAPCNVLCWVGCGWMFNVYMIEFGYSYSRIKGMLLISKSY